MQVLTDLGLGQSFRVSSETDQSYFYNLVEYSNNVPTVEGVLELLNKEFGEDTLRITPNNKIVCKYKGCPYKLQFKHSKTDETFALQSTSTKVHSIQAHKDKANTEL